MPFNINWEAVRSDLQLELVELQSSNHLKQLFLNMPKLEFYELLSKVNDDPEFKSMISYLCLNMEKKRLQQLAYKQQAEHLTQAHTQAMKLLIEGQRKFKLSVNDALSYLELAKSKLGAAEFCEFMQVMKKCKEPNCDAINTISRICCLLQGHPELLQGFGMFLPPSLNLQLQTSGNFLINAMKNQTSDSNNFIHTNGEKFQNYYSFGELSPVINGESLDDSMEYLNESLLEEKDIYATKEVDDDYAILFLSKVKERFLNVPDVFEKFLQLLDSVRKDCMGAQMDIETDVYLEVCDLFQGHDDLIEEFKTFVPNATSMDQEQDRVITPDASAFSSEEIMPSYEASDYPETYSIVHDPSIAPVAKYGSYEEHEFFDKVRAAVGHREVYDNFLRCLMLYNEDVVTRSELLQLATSFLGKFPDLLKKFKDILGFKESGNNIEIVPMKIITLENSRLDPEVALDIDYATGGRNGASYRALPKDHKQPKCSGRTPLCKEVLNDTWVSFPSWSEDSTFVTSCKTQYEEMIYRCEDERFELDMAIRTNACTIQVLENVQKKINKMSAEEKSMFSLDDTLGGTSTVLHQKALHRLYGDKTDELVEGLKRNPVVAVPIILKRLKGKDEEWKEKQRQFNAIWREQIDNYYLKSLDHQGINFKQNDSKSFRSKSLLNEMEMVYAEKKENGGANSSTPHFLLEFKEKCIFPDAINLICQYLKKLPGIFRDDRRRIEHVARFFIPDFFGFPRITIPEDEMEDEEEDDEPEEEMDVENEGDERSGHTSPSGSGVFLRDEGSSDQDESNSVEENELSDEIDKNSFIEESDIFDKMDPLQTTNLPFSLFFVSKNWYVFFRQFHILCERLARLLHESTRKDVSTFKRTEEDGSEQDMDTDYKPSYTELINKLSQLLSGSLDYAQFEDEARSLFGIHAFVSFTMDKLILNIVRQLQQIVTDDICKQSTAFFFQHTKAVAVGGFTSPLETSNMDSDYLKKVEKILGDEKCFKILWHKKDHILTIELMEYDTEDNVVDPCEAEKWSNYLDTYVTEENVSEELLALEQGLPVFLPRNLRKQQEYWKRKVMYVENLWKKRYSSKFLKNNPPLFSRKRKAEFASIKQSHSASKVKNENVDISSLEAKESFVEYCENSNQNVPENQEILQENVDLDDSHDSCMKNIEDIVEENIRTIALALEAVNDCVASNSNDNLDDSMNEVNSVEMVQETSVLDLKNEITTECFYGNESVITDISLDKDATVSMQIESNFSSLHVCSDEESSKDVLNRAQENASVEAKSESSGKTCHDGEDDPDCQIEMTVETPSHVIDTITVPDSPEEINVVSDSDSKEKKRSRGKETLVSKQIRIKNEKHAARQKNSRKMSDYAIRTRKNRIYQDYVKRRIKKNTLKSAHSNAHREKKSKQITRKSEEFDDVTFDYAYFSELSEEDKCQYLAMKYVIVQDDTEGAFKKDSYKVYFVQCCDTYVYRRDCLCRAKQIHKKISEIKTSNFNAWHRVWLDRYVTPAMLKFCSDWLLRSDPEKYKLVCLTISDCTKPPYIPYSKYKVRYYKTEQ